jgi:hypothetical protein
MSVFKRIGKKMGVDFGDFGKWLDGAMRKGSPHRGLLDRYDKSLEHIEVAEMRLEVWIRLNVDKPTFDANYREKGKRLMRLEAASMAVLQKVFDAYKRDRAAGR